MPSHSRSRDRIRGREPGSDYTRRRYRQDDTDDDFDYDPRDRRYRRDEYRRSRGDSRNYEPRSYYDHDADDVNEYDMAPEDPGVPLRRSRGESRRRERSRTNVSPLASPRRTRDRAGESDAERRRRRERRRAAASKHESTESTSSASHLLSADALARLSSQYDEEDRGERSRTTGDSRAERKRPRKRPVMEGESQMLGPFPEDTPRGQSKGRIVSGAYLEEGRNPDMNVRHRGGGGGGPPTQGTWQKEGDWDGSMDESGDGQKSKKRKKWIWIAVAVLLIILAIVIPVAVVMSKKDHDSSDSADGDDDDGDAPANTELDGKSHDSIPVRLIPVRRPLLLELTIRPRTMHGIRCWIRGLGMTRPISM